MSVILFENAIPALPSFLDVAANVNMTEGVSTASFPSTGIARPRATAIQTDQATTFSFNWNLTGMFAPFVAGVWQFDAFYELMGPGEASFPVPSTSHSVPQSGTKTITVAPNVVAEGIYRVVVRMMLLAPGSLHPSPICGFVDLGLVEYYAG